MTEHREDECDSELRNWNGGRTVNTYHHKYVYIDIHKLNYIYIYIEIHCNCA